MGGTMPAIIILIAIITYILGLFTDHFFPTYIDKKGENLATKEDIQEITRLTEETQRGFKEEFEKFSHDLQFKYDYYFHQYEELYSYLYAIVVQSEYVRKTLKVTDGNQISFQDSPFFTISRTHHNTVKYEYKRGEGTKGTKSSEEIATPASEYNFDNLIASIIDKGEYADQELLKKAVSYRLCNTVTDKKSMSGDEALHLQTDIVKLIVRQYNELRKGLGMPYSEEEIQSGILRL